MHQRAEGPFSVGPRERVQEGDLSLRRRGQKDESAADPRLPQEGSLLPVAASFEGVRHA